MDNIPAKSILRKNRSTGWFGTDYTMNLYRGCCHGCIYCDSRSDCYRTENFDVVRSKADALSILRNELSRKIKTGVIDTGSMSDPYNPFEKKALLTRHALELIDTYGFGCAILSKNAMIKRDIDMFLRIKEHSPMLCKMTVTTADDKLSRIIEPGVSAASERFDALARMSQNGLFTGITMMPILPFIEDSVENIVQIVRYGHEAGVRFIYPCFGMTLRSGQKEFFLDKLDKLFPKSGLSERYIQTYGNSYECICPDSRMLWKVFTEECDKYGIIYKMQDIISESRKEYEVTQLSFF